MQRFKAISVAPDEYVQNVYHSATKFSVFCNVSMFFNANNNQKLIVKYNKYGINKLLRHCSIFFHFDNSLKPIKHTFIQARNGFAR